MVAAEEAVVMVVVAMEVIVIRDTDDGLRRRNS